MEQLPIMDIMDEVRRRFSGESTLILTAPPGAGKSTILPLELLNEVWLSGKKILMLEPRRLAARAVASRMASLLGERVGETVGYRIRFERKISANTRIEVLTEGILTRLIQSDNELEGVGMIIFDEFHERSIHADLALVLARQVQDVLREDLRLLVMSATLDAEDLSQNLDGAPVVTSRGRQFPLKFHYLPGEVHARIWDSMGRAIRKALREESGDVLAFFPGQGEIMRCRDLLEESGVEAELHPLFGSLPHEKQEAAILPSKQGRRKVVLASSIAETSLTIEGIRVVVDSGLARVPRFDPRSGLTRLETVNVTRDAADQRAGRAGRLGPGVCYRLWEEGKHQYLLPQRQPEILSADLAPLLLELAEWGVSELNELAWPSPPPAGAVDQARELLEDLGALEEGRITAKGKAMLRLPTHPRLAHLLLEGQELGLAALATDIAALLEERDPLRNEPSTDLSLRVDALRRWRNKERSPGDAKILSRAERLARQWRSRLKVREENQRSDPYQVGRLLALAYPDRLAQQLEGKGYRFRLSNGRRVKMDEADPLSREQFLSIAHLDAGRQEGKVFLAAPLAAEDVSHLAKPVEVLEWDARTGELRAHLAHSIGAVVLRTEALAAPDTEKVGEIICEAIRRDPSLLPWSDELAAWQARVNSLRLWREEENWPDLSQEALIDSLEEWLGPYLGNIRKASDLAKTDLKGLLQGQLPWELASKLDALAPMHMEVPSGSKVRLQYFPDGSPPVLAARVQEMFGMLDSPRINEGRTALLIHLLSPARRPAAVTQDLRSFWENGYPDVRKDLRGRYPKHYWPEDPFTAEAIQGVRPKKKG